MTSLSTIRNRTRPYRRRTWRGVTLDNRTISALIWVESRYVAKAPHKRSAFVIVQGSYSTGVAASGGTHSGGGALDVACESLTDTQIRSAVRWLRRAGFAAWYRPAIPNLWGPHIHAVLRRHRTASPAAKTQCTAFDAGRDGLATNLPDRTWRPDPAHRWSHIRNRPIRENY